MENPYLSSDGSARRVKVKVLVLVTYVWRKGARLKR